MRLRRFGILVIAIFAVAFFVVFLYEGIHGYLYGRSQIIGYKQFNSTLQGESNASVVLWTKGPPQPLKADPCPPPSIRYPSGVCKDGDNRFTLPGTWGPAPSSTGAHFSDENACGAGRSRVYPYRKETHGCCSGKVNHTAADDAIFWPDSYSESEVVLNTSTSIWSFLEVVRGRTVLFVGDSITLVVFEGIVMQMMAKSMAFTQQLVGPGNNQHKVFVPSHNVTLSLLYFYDMEDPKETQVKPNYGLYFLKQAVLSSYLSQADIVMANVGLHNWPIPSYQGRQMMQIHDLMEQEQRRRAPGNQICFLWRKTLPQHFPTERGTGEFGHRWRNWTEASQQMGCTRIPNMWVHPSDQAMEAVRFLTRKGQEKTPVLDYNSIFQDAYSFHSIQKGDCSHYCYSPLIWSPLLLLTAEAIRYAC